MTTAPATMPPMMAAPRCELLLSSSSPLRELPLVIPELDVEGDEPKDVKGDKHEDVEGEEPEDAEGDEPEETVSAALVTLAVNNGVKEVPMAV